MKKILWLSLVGVLCSSTTGCMFDYLERLGDRDRDDDYYSDPYYADPYDPYADDYSYNELNIDGGYLAGDMGNIEGFEVPTYEATGYAYGPDSSTVELHGGEGYWVMARLNITGDLQALDVGTHLEFDSASYDWDSSGSYEGDVVSYVSVTGCSGPTHGDWDWDQGSSSVVVDVGPGVTDNERVVSFQAVYDYAGTTQVVDGSFGYTVY
jgi:hypothetical protein